MDGNVGRKFTIDWTNGGSSLFNSSQGETTASLLSHWTDLRDFLSQSNSSEHPIQDYLKHIDRKVQLYLSGEYDADETLMFIANQIEDIVYALELQSVEKENKKASY